MNRIKIADVAHGDTLIADAGFTCMEPGPHEVQTNANGELYVDCQCGSHTLDGQIGRDGFLVGFTRPAEVSK